MTCFEAAISAVCLSESGSFQPNIFETKDPRWSKGRTCNGSVNPRGFMYSLRVCVLACEMPDEVIRLCDFLVRGRNAGAEDQTNAEADSSEGMIERKTDATAKARRAWVFAL